MSSEVKQLIVVAEGTAALGPYWQTIVSDYLEKIIRSFCGSELNGERNLVSTVELSLVIFNSHGSYCACLVQRSGWTRDIDIFLHWLSSIQFGGGGFNEVATAEGLAEALMMFSPPSGQAQPSNDLKRHCILITASNPHTLPTPVYRPRLQNVERNENGDAQSESRLSDAETVASYFAKCSVSLSVVCPKQLPKIRALYNAGKLNPQNADLSIDTVKNPFYLVLISENFVEARAALSHSATNLPQTQSPVKVDRATVAPSLPVIGQPPAPVTSANGPILNRQPVSVGPVPTATVKVEPSTVTSMAPVPSFPHIPSVARSATQAIPTIQTSSASPVSQDMVTNAENAPDIKPVVVSSMTLPLRAGPSVGANVNLLNNLSQVRQVMNSTALGGAASSVGQSAVAMHMSNMISTGMPTSLPPSQTVFSSGHQGITSMASSGPLMISAQSGQSPGTNNAFSPQTTSNVASNLSISQPMQVMNQGSHSQMMPTPGVAQQGQSEIQQFGGSNSSAPNMQLSQPSSGALQTSQSKYVKVWEGNLSGQRQGQPVLITRLEGYRSASASDSLAANWPPTMQIVRLISQDHMNNKQYVGKADFLVFRAMSQHGFLGQLQDKKLCAVIQLPSQTLLLSVSDKACRLIGMLFPGDMVVFKPQIPNQQQQQQQLQQQHQQQQQIQQQQQQQHHQQQQMPQLQQQQQQHQQQQMPQLQQQQQQHQQQQMPQLQQQQQHQLSQLQHHQQQQQQQQQQQHQLTQLQHHHQQQQQQTSPLNQMQQQTSPLNQMQQQPQQMVMGGQAFAQAPGRSQQGGSGQPNMPGAGFMG